MKNITTSIQPWLSLKSSAKAGKFYKDAFGAIETYRLETPDGGLVLKLSLDGAEFWVSGQSADTDETIAGDLGQDIIKIILTVDNPDAVFEQAIKAGAKEV
ncbi:MAG TPA: VOC family protein, partial [Chitinophagaceae bacterium]